MMTTMDHLARTEHRAWLVAGSAFLLLVTALGPIGCACGRASGRKAYIIYESVQVPTPSGVQYSADASEGELYLWAPDLDGGYVSVGKTFWPKDAKSIEDACRKVFAVQSSSLEGKFPDAKFLGPPAVFENEWLRFYGGSWRRPNKTMISMAFTVVDGKMLKIVAVLPSTKHADKKSQQARKLLQEVFGGIKKAEPAASPARP